MPAMNDNAVQLFDRGAAIAGKPCSHRSLRHKQAPSPRVTDWPWLPPTIAQSPVPARHTALRQSGCSAPAPWHR
ncbi:hypothetical protein CF597_14020 [Pseudomonas sp. PSB1]|nr:hypothetical protein [Pseudomonas sp. PSB1]